jgi:hypothetical protein
LGGVGARFSETKRNIKNKMNIVGSIYKTYKAGKKI